MRRSMSVGIVRGRMIARFVGRIVLGVGALAISRPIVQGNRRGAVIDATSLGMLKRSVSS